MKPFTCPLCEKKQAGRILVNASTRYELEMCSECYAKALRYTPHEDTSHEELTERERTVAQWLTDDDREDGVIGELLTVFMDELGYIPAVKERNL